MVLACSPVSERYSLLPASLASNKVRIECLSNSPGRMRIKRLAGCSSAQAIIIISENALILMLFVVVFTEK